MTVTPEDWTTLRRPRVLVRAARMLAAWRGGSAGGNSSSPPRACSSSRLRYLLDAEKLHEEFRLHDRSNYRIDRHVEALAELMTGMNRIIVRRAGPA